MRQAKVMKEGKKPNEQVIIEVKLDGKPIGRPSVYSEELADEISLRLMEGESLRSICSEERMPHRTTVFNCLMSPEHPFSTKYARAKEVQAEGMIEELLEIADEPQNDTLIGEMGDKRPNTEYIQRSKLRIETRQWIAM